MGDTAYQAGRDAFANDADQADNPYTPLSPDWHDWHTGWIDASEDDWTKREGK